MSRIWARRPGSLECRFSEEMGGSENERSLDRIRVWISSESFGGEASEDDDDRVVLLLGVLGVSLSVAIGCD